MRPAAILLAGGASRRMGRPKALLPIAGTTFLGRLIALYTRHCEPVVVVLGHQAEVIRPGFVNENRVRWAVNPDPERGQLSSLQTGLAHTPEDRDTLFQPIDYPAVSETTIATLSALADGLAIPVCENKRGHPIRITPAIARQLCALPATAQARDVIRAHYPEAQFLEVHDRGTITDIDTPEEYTRWIA